MFRRIVGIGSVCGVLVAAAASPAMGQDTGYQGYSWDHRGGAVCGARQGLLGGQLFGRDRLRIIGLTADQRLVCFREDNPRGADDIGYVSGLSGDARLVGIDFRPANRALYGVGNAGGLYTIDPRTAVATLIGQLNVPLQGTSFGVDVNPAADALRVISDAGQNLRYSFATGATFTDGPLTYPPAAAAGVTGAAYTNNDGDPNTATTLFDLDSTLDQVAIQSPANSGQLAATGKLGADNVARDRLRHLQHDQERHHCRRAGVRVIDGRRCRPVLRDHPGHRKGDAAGNVPAGRSDHRHRHPAESAVVARGRLLAQDPRPSNGDAWFLRALLARLLRTPAPCHRETGDWGQTSLRKCRWPHEERPGQG